MYNYIYLFPAVTSTAVKTRGSQVKFSRSGPYTPLICLSSTIFLTESSPLFTAWRVSDQSNISPLSLPPSLSLSLSPSPSLLLSLSLPSLPQIPTFPMVPRRFLSHLVSSSLAFWMVWSMAISRRQSSLHKKNNKKRHFIFLERVWSRREVCVCVWGGGGREEAGLTFSR